MNDFDLDKVDGSDLRGEAGGAVRNDGFGACRMVERQGGIGVH
jgi:hypothetical protein